MDMKELLRDAAEDVQTTSHIPADVARRARRRRARNGMLAGITAVALLVGGGFGVRGALGLLESAPVKKTPAETPTEPATTVTEAKVRTFVLDFLDARWNTDDRAHEFLSDMAADQYHRGEGGLHLFGPIATTEIEKIVPSEQDANLYEATVVLYERPTEAVASEVREVLLVGPDPNRQGPGGLIVLAAGITGGPTGAEAEAVSFVTKFMEARINGPDQAPGAESFLSPEGKRMYDEADRFGNQLYLYGHPWDDPDFRWTSFAITDAQRGGKERTYVVDVNIERSTPDGTGEPPASFWERLIVGPGQDLEGKDRPWVVLSAEWVDV
jgi:hypothetical protein